MKKNLGSEIFENRRVVIATMHGKEMAIAPLFYEAFKMDCIVPKDFNTDQFGTFTGEIKRVKNHLETVRAKAFAALSLSDTTLAIASEGSFGPHPESPFITGNEEIVILIDSKNNFEIIGRYFTQDTNFNHQKIGCLLDLNEFSERIGFPEHGIVLKIVLEEGSESIYKDFNDLKSLQNKVLYSLKEGSIINAETDMRAMNNPTRVKAIKLATQNLLENINSICPSCNAPGFSIVEVMRGLACELCHLPTKGVRAYIYSCQKCKFRTERLKDSVRFQEAVFCDYCNP